MIFSELYSAYYNVVAAVLRAAADHAVTPGEIRRIADRYAFGESSMNIDTAFREERWQLLYPDGTPVTDLAPTMPLTLLQKQWLKSVSQDPRVRLFDITFPDLSDVEPLFRPEDVVVFDRYSDGDPYEDEGYREHFRVILNALRMEYPLTVEFVSGKGNPVRLTVMPKYLEYSEKDDKFRLIGAGRRPEITLNLARITDVRPCAQPFEPEEGAREDPGRTVVFELVDQRNALERALLHFAHFRKEAERLDMDHYRISVQYDKSDETEMVIRILSFGPMIRVTSPEYFRDLIKDRLRRQKSLGTD